MPSEEKEYVKVHVKMERELYEKLWEITKKEYIVPIKKFHIILNKIIKMGIDKYEELDEGGETE